MKDFAIRDLRQGNSKLRILSVPLDVRGQLYLSNKLL